MYSYLIALMKLALSFKGIHKSTCSSSLKIQFRCTVFDFHVRPYASVIMPDILKIYTTEKISPDDIPIIDSNQIHLIKPVRSEGTINANSVGIGDSLIIPSVRMERSVGSNLTEVSDEGKS